MNEDEVVADRLAESPGATVGAGVVDGEATAEGKGVDEGKGEGVGDAVVAAPDEGNTVASDVGLGETETTVAFVGGAERVGEGETLTEEFDGETLESDALERGSETGEADA